MTKEETYNTILDNIIFYTKKKDGIYFDFPVSDSTSVMVSCCSHYSPEQLIEHLYSGDLIDCFEYFLMFSYDNSYNKGVKTVDELVDTLVNYTQDKAKIELAQKQLKKNFKYCKEDEEYREKYFKVFGFMPGKVFGKSQHESIPVQVRISFNHLTKDHVKALRSCTKNNDFYDLYKDCPEVSNCSIYFDPDIDDIILSGTLIDAMMLDELLALENKENPIYENGNIEEIKVFA